MRALRTAGVRQEGRSNVTVGSEMTVTATISASQRGRGRTVFFLRTWHVLLPSGWVESRWERLGMSRLNFVGTFWELVSGREGELGEGWYLCICEDGIYIVVRHLADRIDRTFVILQRF